MRVKIWPVNQRFGLRHFPLPNHHVNGRSYMYRFSGSAGLRLKYENRCHLNILHPCSTNWQTIKSVCVRGTDHQCVHGRAIWGENDRAISRVHHMAICLFPEWMSSSPWYLSLRQLTGSGQWSHVTEGLGEEMTFVITLFGDMRRTAVYVVLLSSDKHNGISRQFRNMGRNNETLELWTKWLCPERKKLIYLLDGNLMSSVH